MNKPKTVNTPGFSKNAPYSQAVVVKNIVFTSGCIGVNSEGKLVDSFKSQTVQALSNLEAVLSATGTTLSKALKVTVYLSDMKYYTEFNQIYSTYFEKDPPSRTCYSVLGLPFGALLEIECVATL